MQVGARLHFELDTSSASSPSVVIQYLESHDGMGTAHVDCSGCQCEPTRVDASGAVARLSTLATREVEVTSHPRCELRFMLMNSTSAASAPGSPPGRAKFKLVRLFVLGSDLSSSSGAAARPMQGTVDHPHGASGTGLPSWSWQGWDAPMANGAEANAEAARNGALEMLQAARRARRNAVGEKSLRLLQPQTIRGRSTHPQSSGASTADQDSSNLDGLPGGGAAYSHGARGRGFKRGRGRRARG